MPDKEISLNRREFITKSVAGMGLVAIISSPLVSILKLRRDKAADGDGQITSAVSEAPKDAKRLGQWCLVLDLRRCDGCTGLDLPPQCTQACTGYHFVPKGQEWMQVFKVEAQGGGTYFQPTPCMHCENAPCVNVCPVAATYQTEEGVVLIDQRRCIGCRMCLGACPYQRRFFNWGQPEQPPEVNSIPYSPERQVPAIRGTAMKCDLCANMLHEDQPPVCVNGCPRKVIYVGDLNTDVASNGKEVVKLSRFLAENSAYHLKEELGTQPKVWFIPGHGEAVGRDVYDTKNRLPSVWAWGGNGYNYHINVVGQKQ